jgi:ELWxxDGT repeat protein
LGNRYFFTYNSRPERGYYSAPIGADLSVSDGTRSGTGRVKGLPPALADASLDSIEVAGGRLWLITSREQKPQLWVLDAAGRNPQQPPAAPTYGSSFVAVEDRIYFSARDPEHGTELWSSTGTAEGTALVKDINPGPAGSDPRELTAVGQALFFRATDPEHGSELWRSAGSAATTTLVKDIAPGFRDSGPSQLVALGDAFYLAATDLTHGTELWRSDGTAAGTTLLKDINPGSGGSLFDQPFLAVAGRLFLVADDGAHGLEYWASDGTTAGTALLADIKLGPEGSAARSDWFGPHRSIEVATLFNDSMLVPADDGTHGTEFYRIGLDG